MKLHSMKLKVFAERSNMGALGIDEHADTPNMCGKGRTNIPGGRKRYVTRARGIKIQADEICATVGSQ
jgi:hypothetical protein